MRLGEGMYPAEYASLLLPIASPNPLLTPLRTDGQMARNVNMGLCEVDVFFE